MFLGGFKTQLALRNLIEKWIRQGARPLLYLRESVGAFREFGKGCTVAIAVSLVLMPLVMSCSRDAITVSSPINAAEQTAEKELRRFLQGLYEEAVNNRDSALHRGRLAMAYDANSFTDEAIETYAQAHQLDGTELRWVYLQGLAEATGGRIAEAIELMTNAIRLDATYLPSYLAKGYWQLDLGEFESACATFEQARLAIVNPNFQTPVSLGLAQCRLELGDVEIALRTLDSSDLGTSLPYAEFVRARVERTLGEPRHDHNNVLVNAAPGRISWSDPLAGEVVEYTRGLSGESILVRNLIEGGRAEDAIQLVESLRNRYPDESFLIDLHSAAQVRLNRIDVALATLSQGLLMFPNEHLLHFNRALLLERTGQLDDALVHYRRTIELRDDAVTAYDALASILVDRELFEDARSTLEASLAYRVPDAKTFYLLGVLSGSTGEWHKSVEYLTAATKMRPVDASTYASLALSLSELKRYEDALAAIERAREIDPADPKVERAIKTLLANGVLATP